jgi:ribonuclease P protein component
MLTFNRPAHKGALNTAGRRMDLAAVFILNAKNSKDYAHEAHLPAEQPCPLASPRFPPAHVDRKRSRHPERPPRAWPQEAVGLIAGATAGRDMRGYTVIKKRSDFLAANRGKRYAAPGFVLLVFDRRDDDPAKRVGITITKKVGNAVVRNRMRRRFRELARQLLDNHGKAGADHILIGREGGIERDFVMLREEMVKALDKLSFSIRPEPVEGRNSAHSRSSTSSDRTDN